VRVGRDSKCSSRFSGRRFQNDGTEDAVLEAPDSGNFEVDGVEAEAFAPPGRLGPRTSD
jgi:hypothetical protein